MTIRDRQGCALPDGGPWSREQLNLTAQHPCIQGIMQNNEKAREFHSS